MQFEMGYNLTLVLLGLLIFLGGLGIGLLFGFRPVTEVYVTFDTNDEEAEDEEAEDGEAWKRR